MKELSVIQMEQINGGDVVACVAGSAVAYLIFGPLGGFVGHILFCYEDLY